MPCLVTHYYFGKDVVEKLDESVVKTFSSKQDYFETFCQGPDLLFSYNLINFKKGKEWRDLGHHIQRTKTKEFFFNLIDLITKNHFETNPEVISFLYGFICHYALDTMVHPYVFYKTGCFFPKKKETHKYNSKHLEMETWLDAYLIFQREKMFPKDFLVHNCVLSTEEYSDQLRSLIEELFQVTYEKEGIGDIYLESVKHTRDFYRTLRYDPTGIKRFGYSIIDFLTPRSIINLQFVSYHINAKKNRYYLNLEKEQWSHPGVPTETSNLSFPELYRSAMDRALHMIEGVDKVLFHNGKKSNLDSLFMNLSYVTGKDCDESVKLQHFEY